MKVPRPSSCLAVAGRLTKGSRAFSGKDLTMKDLLDGKLLLVGCGKMGGAMLEGWLSRGLEAGDVVVQDPAPPPEIVAMLAEKGVRRVDQVGADDLGGAPAVILMAVKPQVMDDVFPSVAGFAGENTVTVSVAAGKTIQSFERFWRPTGR